MHNSLKENITSRNEPIQEVKSLQNESYKSLKAGAEGNWNMERHAMLNNDKLILQK